MPLLDHYREQADKLVWAAGANASLAYKPILDQNPHVTSFGSEKWEFTLTVAGVYAAIIQLVHERPLKDAETEEVLDIVNKSLDAKYPEGTAALEECRTMVDYSFAEVPAEQGEEAAFTLSDRIGAWILYKLNGPKEVKEGGRLIRSLGLAVTSTFSNWWT